MAAMKYSFSEKGTLIQMNGKNDLFVSKENFGPMDLFEAGIGA